MQLIRFLSAKKTQAFAGKSFRTLAIICVVVSLVAITFFRKTIEMNNIAALIILAVAFGLPGFVLTGAAASRTENQRIEASRSSKYLSP